MSAPRLKVLIVGRDGTVLDSREVCDALDCLDERCTAEHATLKPYCATVSVDIPRRWLQGCACSGAGACAHDLR